MFQVMDKIFEVEKKAWPISDDEFERVQQFLQENADFLEEKMMDSYLLLGPNQEYLRIRYANGLVIATLKGKIIGEAARPESNEVIDKTEVNSFLRRQIENVGFDSCLYIMTQRTTYKMNGLKIELDDKTYFGKLVEVEALTYNKEELDELTKKVDDTFRQMGLIPVDIREYIGYYNKIYDMNNKPIGEYFNLFSPRLQ